MDIRKVSLIALIMTCMFSSKVQARDISYIEGKTRYETAALIANEITYDKAILVNGMALVDGLSASGLSGAINSPILLTSVNNIPDATLQALNGVNTVYIVGGNNVVSIGIEEKIKSMGINVIRIGGSDRYKTSYAVADEIEKIKGISEIYYVNGLSGEADAMSIAPVAAKSGNPVILTNGKDTSYIKSGGDKFIIGGNTVMNSNFDKYGERLGGKTRFETNKLIINRFFDDKSDIFISKSDVLIDALTSSALKKPVVLVSNTSDKSVIAGAKSITALGGINPSIISKVNSYLYEDTVVFYTQHQDDETLFAGSAIVDAIESVGRENVYIVLITKGDKSAVFNQDRYLSLSDDEKAMLRNNEFMAAVDRLGVASDNIILCNQNEYEVDYKSLSDLIEGFESHFNSVTHIVHSYKYDIHSEHMKAGQIIYDLYNEGKIKDTRFFARFTEGDRIPLEYLIQAVSDNEVERNKVMEACDEYKLDNGDMIREGIGYKSVGWMFNSLKNDKNTTSYLHKPGA